MTIMIARAKISSVLKQLKKSSILICSDEVIRCNGQIREKPTNNEEARIFLETYRQYPAEAINGVVVYNSDTGKSFEGNAVAKVYFKYLPDAFIDYLIEQGDIFTCSGGFAIELMGDYIEYDWKVY